MAPLDAKQPIKILRGTWDQILLHSDEIPKTSELEVRIFEPAVKKRKAESRDQPKTGRTASKPRELKGRGMLAGILSSEDFMRRKQEEIDIEERARQ